MPKKKSSEPTHARKVLIAQLAGSLLPLVQSMPGKAYASELARNTFAATHATERKFSDTWSHENNVGAALRFLEKEGFLISKKVRHPRGDLNTMVKLYEVTILGAFFASLAANQFRTAAAA